MKINIWKLKLFCWPATCCFYHRFYALPSDATHPSWTECTAFSTLHRRNSVSLVFFIFPSVAPLSSVSRSVEKEKNQCIQGRQTSRLRGGIERTLSLTPRRISSVTLSCYISCINFHLRKSICLNHCAKDDIRTMMIHDTDDISAVSVFRNLILMTKIINFFKFI